MLDLFKPMALTLLSSLTIQAGMYVYCLETLAR